MECLCKTWVRGLNGGFEIIDGKQYPEPKHLNGCPIQQRQLYKRVEVDGTSCILKPSELADFLDGSEPTDYKIIDVMLTPEQVEKMPEFQGF